MSTSDSATMLAMVEGDGVDGRAATILRAYFRAVCDVIWDDAHAEHGLV